MKKKFYYPKRGYLLQVLPNPNSTYGTTGGGGNYSYGTSVQISASPNPGYAFMQWKEGETITNPRTVTVNDNATYNALFYKLPDGVLRIVDDSLNLYTYDEWSNLVSPPSAIGVAIHDGDDWIVMYKNYIGTSGESIIGYKLANTNQVSYTPLTPTQLLYPHSGKTASDAYKNDYPSAGYAAYEASLLNDGGLDWYIPNLYEYTQIFGKVEDSSLNAHDGFNSHFTLLGLSTIIETATIRHAHWSCDVGYGASATAGQTLPYRVGYKGNNTVGYQSSGDYTYADNYNYVRPVARIAATSVTITYNANGADSGTVPASTSVYKGDLDTVASNSGNLTKDGKTFNGWNTASDGSGTHYNVGTTLHNHADKTLYAEWM